MPSGCTVIAKGVAPGNFYSTNIYPTEIPLNGGWCEVEKQRMDTVIVVQPGLNPAARCTLFRDLQLGEQVVCGVEGVRVRYPDSTSIGEFAFMNAAVSSERRVEASVKTIAWEMRRMRERAGKIVVVGSALVNAIAAPSTIEAADDAASRFVTALKAPLKK